MKELQDRVEYAKKNKSDLLNKPFKVNANNWVGMSDIVLNKLEWFAQKNNETEKYQGITRKLVLDFCGQSAITNSERRDIFIYIMIWGYANSGYGAYRVTKMLEYNFLDKTLEEGFEHVKKNNIEKAFKCFSGIPGLGISFVSKILYFLTRNNEKDYALIFDMQVCKALLCLTNPDFIKIMDVMPKNDWKSYEFYLQLMRKEAIKMDVEADFLECVLYEEGSNQLFIE
jgi:hypothetical protein